MGGLSDGRQGIEDAAVHLARIGLTLHVEDLVKVEGGRDLFVQCVDLLAVTVKQLDKARFTARCAAAAEELDVFDGEVDLVEVGYEVL